jgi:CBS domain-containing protein
MQARAKDIMQTTVITVGVDDPLSAIHRLFLDEEISGAPVVSDHGEVVGVVTIRDLLWDHCEERNVEESDLEYFRGYVNVDVEDLRSHGETYVARLAERVASDVMTSRVVSVEPEASVSEVARVVQEHMIHRVLVAEPGEKGWSLSGIISLFDLVALLED